MNPGPDPRAALRGLMALVLDMARIDPDRRPSSELVRWHRELAAELGVIVESADTNRELLNQTLRLHAAAAREAASQELAAR